MKYRENESFKTSAYALHAELMQIIRYNFQSLQKINQLPHTRSGLHTENDVIIFCNLHYFKGLIQLYYSWSPTYREHTQIISRNFHFLQIFIQILFTCSLLYAVQALISFSKLQERQIKRRSTLLNMHVAQFYQCIFLKYAITLDISQCSLKHHLSKIVMLQK